MGVIPMNSRQNPLFWSFGVGVWFGTRVRISVFFPLFVVLVCFKLGLYLGGAVSLVMAVSVLLHEFGHIFAARATGGTADEILLWPLGGLAYVEPARTFQAQFLTAAAGPLVNLVLCGASLPFILSSPHFSDVWNPFVLPIAALSDNLVVDYLLLTFSLNWLLLLLNLLPVYPLDGGQMLKSWLTVQWGSMAAAEFSLKVGVVTAVLLGIVGFLASAIWVVALSFLIAVLALQDVQRIQMGEMYDESFMGYDFSQGYTSLERSQPATAEPAAKSMLQRWREKRQTEKRRREEAEIQAAETKLDALLAKVHANGMDCLTEAEKRDLARASARLRGRKQS